ncbi:hypothetical protein ACHAWC_004209 [Mediolabrus comicus]
MHYGSMVRALLTATAVSAAATATDSLVGLPEAFLPDINNASKLIIITPSSDNNNNNINNNIKQPRIIGGDQTTRDRFPYVASLVDTLTDRHVCGGSLIASDIILTAGHCSGHFNAIQVGRHSINDGELEAALLNNGIVSDNNNNEEEEDGYEFHVVEKHVVHPLHSNVIRSDFAVAKLYGRVSSVQPVKLNTRNDIPSNDEFVTILGYGIIKKDGTITNDMSQVLLEADVQYMPNTECSMTSALYNGEVVAYDGFVDENMLCAWQLNTDACQGDSGGPMIYPSSDGNPENDKQIGIVSWGLGCALSDFPGVYSRVSAEMDWLTQQVCDLSDDPPEYFNCMKRQSDLSGLMQDVTVVVEIDEEPQEIAWMMELDLSSGGGDGGKVTDDVYKPFGSYTLPSSTAVEVLSVAPDKQYTFTLLDRGENNANTNFRLCYGDVSQEECMAAKKSDDNSILICDGTSSFRLITAISCPVVRQTVAPTLKPTTLAPTDNPTEAVWNDLMFGTTRPFFPPPSVKPTLKPTISPTPNPSMTPTDVPTPKPSNEPSVFFTQAPAKDAPTDFFSKFDTDAPPPKAEDEVEMEVKDMIGSSSNIICFSSLYIVCLSAICYFSIW